MIQEMQLPPKFALFLLAQYTQVFIAGDPQLSVTSATDITNTVLAVWRSGHYTPSAKYPYTLEETLNDAQGDQDTKQEYAAFFQPLLLTTQSMPSDVGEVCRISLIVSTRPSCPLITSQRRISMVLSSKFEKQAESPKVSQTLFIGQTTRRVLVDRSSYILSLHHEPATTSRASYGRRAAGDTFV